MDINGFKYCLRTNSNGLPAISLSRSELKYPESLSKYFTLNENNVSAFIQRKLYASAPEFFNDLFDSFYLNLDFNELTFEMISKAFDANEVESGRVEFELDKERYLKKMRNTCFAIWNAHCGIICMTDNDTNDLMWAHYTNNEGFLIEFDYTQFPKSFESPCPVNYIPSNKMLKILSKDVLLSLYVNSLLKKAIWKYENEFRFIVHDSLNRSFLTSGRFSNEDHNYIKASRLIQYPSKAIKKVILGFKFFNNFLVEPTPEGKIVDFGNKGIIHKALIDNLIENNIRTEWIHIDLSSLNLLCKTIEISKLSGTTYKLN